MGSFIQVFLPYTRTGVQGIEKISQPSFWLAAMNCFKNGILMCEAQARTSPCIADDGNLLIVRQCSFLRKNQDSHFILLCNSPSFQSLNRRRGNKSTQPVTMKGQKMNTIRFINPNLYVSNLKRIGRDFKLYSI